MRRVFERTVITQHTLSSIATDATGGGALDISEGDDKQRFVTGILRNLLVVCDSTNFDVHIGQKSSFWPEDGDDILSLTGNDKRCEANNQYIGWINGDATRSSNLYVIVHNNRSNYTGTVRIQMVNDVNKRFSAR